MATVTEPTDSANSAQMPTTPSPEATSSPFPLPRITIKYCTQCRWMLRAAYFAQELLTTFGTAIGEIALQPATGGIFTVYLTYIPQVSSEPTASSEQTPETETVLLWDRKSEGGFPETKVLKQRLRDRIQPEKDLGHSDKGGKKQNQSTTINGGEASATTSANQENGVDAASASKQGKDDCLTCP